MTRFRIQSPLRNFTGKVAEVQFQAGTGYVEDTSDGGRAALSYFKRSGYGVAEAPEQVPDPGSDPATPSGDGQPPAPTVEPFDPAAHTVDQVRAHLDRADADEALRVLAAEAAGQARKGITSSREQLLAAKTPAPADDQKGPSA
jgi:hypothetical protein